MWVPVAVWQPCERLYTYTLATYLLTTDLTNVAAYTQIYPPGGVSCHGRSWISTITWLLHLWRKYFNDPTNQHAYRPFYGHYKGKCKKVKGVQQLASPPTTLSAPVKNWRILLVQSFTARMPLPTATSAFSLGSVTFCDSAKRLIFLLNILLCLCVMYILPFLFPVDDLCKGVQMAQFCQLVCI